MAALPTAVLARAHGSALAPVLSAALPSTPVRDERSRTPLELVGVIGAGTMGAGIAQVALEHGHEVVLHDIDEAAVEHGIDRIRAGLERRAERLGLDADTIDDWVEARLAGLRQAESLDVVGDEADVVIEAAIEDLELKRDVFRVLDAATDREVILASNTSALSIAAIADATANPARVVGLHFFNPAPVMRLVEVVSGPATDPDVAARAAGLVEAWGKTAVRSADSPGFIVNRVNRPFTLEALAINESGSATPEDIDAAVRDDGYPMGPFELMDLIGIDVNLAVATAIWESFGRADRFRPSALQEHLVEEGRLGRKTGEGFYRYDGSHERPDRSEPSEASRQIADRITLAIVAEAYRALDDHVADAADIDRALRLGAGHPVGPFERVAAFGGAADVLRRLGELSSFGPRFDPPAGLVEAASRPA
jgi:3-hydroxybutyryl-CoA dehydrogenase